jgi:UDP-N-acetylglucosamine 2-epimerase
MKIVSVVGARPEFIQSMPVSRALRSDQQEILVHTGQHYDYLMSQKFFDELGIPAPKYNLEVGSGTHGQQTAEILVRLEQVLLEEKPDLVIVRGDTNSTLAGALVASKLQIPLAHIEAGERSFNRRMAEEINRLVADRIADMLYCVSRSAMANLANEGITENVHLVGDVMLDALRTIIPVANSRSEILKKLDLHKGEYALVTIHRAENTDNSERLLSIATALNETSEKIIFPIHPRTRKALNKIDVKFSNHIHITQPVGYYDMLVLEENARLIATDSGGVQREAYYMGIPCLTLRDETEWIETVEVGWNKLVGVEPAAILEAWNDFTLPDNHPPIYGKGDTGEKIAELLLLHVPLVSTDATKPKRISV